MISSKSQFYIFLALLLVVIFILTSGNSQPVAAQEGEAELDAAVEAIFNTLTPNERVGQLFMVSFRGNNIKPGSDIAELIQEYRVGGVVLSAANRNFTNTLPGAASTASAAQVLALTNGLQQLAQQNLPAPAAESEVATENQEAAATVAATSTLTSPLAAEPAEPYTPMPLFIALTQEGDGFPFTSLRGGMIDLPNQMALGATWDVENARLTGIVVGQELALVGVNMLFGPSLDVLDNPRPERGGSLGTRTFGGHPFWVGKLGQAYIQGVHQGSQNKVLTIAKNFPGFGSSDREINQGVPIILKSLDDLRQTELLPFFKVTRLNPDNPAEIDGLTDGLMTGHIRYQGLQGNVPISLDARNLPTLLALKEIAPWREAGGLVVSAPLGVPAALEGIAAGTDSFPARRLAQDAFLAGNDIVYVANFTFKDRPEEEMANLKNAIDFFREKYASDPNFQAAVDRSVRRIIRAKIKAFGPELLTNRVENSKKENMEQLRRLSLDLDQIAQAGVSLITPITQEGVTPLPGPPQPGDQILIFTDDRIGQDCPDCLKFRLIETTALQQIILELFGPDATGQISSEQLTSLDFSDLKDALAASDSEAVAASVEPAGDEADNPDVDALLKQADWIIFVMLDLDPNRYPESDAVRTLLRNRYEMLRNKNLVLFAFNAPYFLDETEISQLTAYYGFFSKGQAYLRAAARLLFQQFQPTGASPVGIPAIGPLDLSPDPNQTIQLMPVHKIDTAGAVISLEDQPKPITTLDLKVGEGILFTTNVIVDKNGRPVPDGTSVDFFRFYPLEGLSLEPVTATTVDGVAEITIVKERDTPLQVRAASDLAAQAVPYNIGPGIIDTPTPTATATSTSTPTPTGTATPTDTATPTPQDTATPTPEPQPTSPPPEPVNSNLSTGGPVDRLDLIYSLLGMLIIGGIAFTLGGDRFSLEERIRPALVAIASGLVGYIAYILLALAFPHVGLIETIIDQGGNGHWVAPLISLLCAILGMVIWYLKPGRIFWAEEGLSRTRLDGEE